MKDRCVAFFCTSKPVTASDAGATECRRHLNILWRGGRRFDVPIDVHTDREEAVGVWLIVGDDVGVGGRTRAHAAGGTAGSNCADQCHGVQRVNVGVHLDIQLEARQAAATDVRSREVQPDQRRVGIHRGGIDLRRGASRSGTYVQASEAIGLLSTLPAASRATLRKP